MPIRHTVVFRLVHEAGSAASDAFFADARAALTSIPGVQGFEIAEQVGPTSDLTHQFAMTFADTAAYERYNTHPTHVAFVEGRWVPEVAEFQEYDFVAM
jgi:hypothetical protein